MRSRFSRLRRRSEEGAVAAFVAIFVPVSVILAAFAVDITGWWVEIQRLQKTADAASLAAAAFMPDPLVSGSTARTVGEAEVTRNGFTAAQADFESGGRPTQVRVTMTSTVPNTFAGFIGIPETTLSRTAVAEFSGPSPLGSPCNVHGNEPWQGLNTPGSALPSPLPSNCSSFPQFWSTIVGPEVYKTQGDRF